MIDSIVEFDTVVSYKFTIFLLLTSDTSQNEFTNHYEALKPSDIQLFMSNENRKATSRMFLSKITESKND